MESGLLTTKARRTDNNEKENLSLFSLCLRAFVVNTFSCAQGFRAEFIRTARYRRPRIISVAGRIPCPQFLRVEGVAPENMGTRNYSCRLVGEKIFYVAPKNSIMSPFSLCPPFSRSMRRPYEENSNSCPSWLNESAHKDLGLLEKRVAPGGSAVGVFYL